MPHLEIFCQLFRVKSALFFMYLKALLMADIAIKPPNHVKDAGKTRCI